MRLIEADEISDLVAELYMETNVRAGPDHLASLRRALDQERSPLGREVLSDLLANAEVALAERVAICQDTGYAVCFFELGQDVHIVGGTLQSAVDAGVRRGCLEGYLRASMVQGPLHRQNTSDNTPGIVHVDLVEGEACNLTLLVKGAGCDNMSGMKMLTPSAGRAGVVDFVVSVVERAGPNASPPVTIGVGIGGTFESVTGLAARALTRPSGQPSSDPQLAELEVELLDRINATGIGPAGFGGTVTALAVHVDAAPTHIAALPVAVNLDCHSHRVGRAQL